MSMEIDLNKLTELTQWLTPISDMAVLMDVPESFSREYLNNPDTEAYAVYRHTRAEVALRYRKADIELAQASSPTAAEAVRLHLKRMDE